MFKKFQIVIVALLLTVSSAFSLEMIDLTIPDTLDSGMGELILNGAGVRKKFGFKLYLGGLYLKEKTTDSAKIIAADEPMAIVMVYKRNGVVEKAKEIFLEGFKNSAGDKFDSIKSEVETFISLIAQAEKKDVWKYVYTPGNGVGIYYNDVEAGRIKGLEFKKALFAIWLLETDAFGGDKNLRAGMLGKD
jgi:hypothetical protein